MGGGGGGMSFGGGRLTQTVAANRSTWDDLVGVPSKHSEPMSQIAPKAWRAMCDLVGGAERVATEPSWGDGFAVNLGKPGMEWEPPAADFDGAGWHKVIPRPLIRVGKCSCYRSCC